MIDLGRATATGGGGAIRLPNQVSVNARNAANSGDIQVFRFNSSDRFEIMTTMQLAEGVTFVLGTSTGTQIGFGTTEKLAFWGATPIARPSSTGTATGFTAGAGTAVNDQSTFTGAVGSTAYRLSDIVKHLKNLGLIAP